MANTIGDAASKIIELPKTIPAEENESAAQKTQKYGKMAIFYCGCAAKWTDLYGIQYINDKDLNYYEKNYRNYGVACERYDRAVGEQYSHAETIISNYLKAFYHIVNGTKVPAQRVHSVYKTLRSYLKKYFDNELAFEGNNGLLHPFDGAEALAAACTYNYRVSEELLDRLQKMAEISELAMADMPLCNIPTVMNGFAYTYVVLLKTEGNKNVCAAFTEDCSSYMAKIDAAMRRLAAMNVDDDYSKELSERYELLKALLRGKQTSC